MNPQISDERKQQSHPVSVSQVNIKRPSLFPFKSKFLSSLHSRSYLNSHPPLSNDTSLSRPKSPSSMTSKDSVYTSASTLDRGDVASKKSSKMRQTVDAAVSKFTMQSTRPIRSTSQKTTSHYRRPMPKNVFSTLSTVPGVWSLAFTGCLWYWFIHLLPLVSFLLGPYTVTHSVFGYVPLYHHLYLSISCTYFASRSLLHCTCYAITP
jgi:hypothetical protein